MGRKKLNRTPLTDTERDVLRLVASGMRNHEIADHLGTRDSTIAFHIRNIRKKLKADSRADLVKHYDAHYESRDHTVSSAKIETVGPNEKVVSARSERIWTVEQLLIACEIDPDEWEVTKIIANKWEGYRSGKTVNLVYEEGKIESGSIEDDGSIFTAPLVQIKVWLVRREPVAVKPVIRPVVIEIPHYEKKKPEFVDELRCVLVIPDTQFGFNRGIFSRHLEPFHDRRALDIVLQIAQHYAFTEVVHLGDILDFPDWSDKFFRSPEFLMMSQPALIEAAWFLARIAAFQPDADLYVLEGNHEFRMRSKIINHVSEGYELKAVHQLDLPPAWSPEYLLNLAGMGYTWVGNYPKGKLWLSDQLALEHGKIAKNIPGTTAKDLAESRNHSTIFGHIHRAEHVVVPKRGRDNQFPVHAMSPGFLGRLDEVIPGHNDNQNWTQGFGIVHYLPSGEVYPTIVPIHDGTAIYDGQVWESSGTYLGELIDFAGPKWGF